MLPVASAIARIRGSVIKIDGVSIRADRLPARKHDILDVSAALIGSFRTEHPGVSPLQTDLRLLQVKERQAQAIDASGCRLPHSVVNRQPSFCCFNRRRAQADLVRIPPSAAARLEDDLVASPMPQVGRVGDPHVRAQRRHRPVNQRPKAANSPGQQRRVLVLRLHDDAISLKALEVLCQRQGDSGTASRK